MPYGFLYFLFIALRFFIAHNKFKSKIKCNLFNKGILSKNVILPSFHYPHYQGYPRINQLI